MTNYLSMIEGCSTDFLTDVLLKKSATGPEKVISSSNRHKIGRLTKKKDVDIAKTTSDELQSVARIVPFFTQNPSTDGRFWKCDWGLKFHVCTTSCILSFIYDICF